MLIVLILKSKKNDLNLKSYNNNLIYKIIKNKFYL